MDPLSTNNEIKVIHMILLSLSIWIQWPYPQWFTDHGQETKVYMPLEGQVASCHAVFLDFGPRPSQWTGYSRSCGDVIISVPLCKMLWESGRCVSILSHQSLYSLDKVGTTCSMDSASNGDLSTRLTQYPHDTVVFQMARVVFQMWLASHRSGSPIFKLQSSCQAFIACRCFGHMGVLILHGGSEVPISKWLAA